MQTIVLPVSARDLFHLFHVEFPLGAGNKLVAHGRGKSLDLLLQFFALAGDLLHPGCQRFVLRNQFL